MASDYLGVKLDEWGAKMMRLGASPQAVQDAVYGLADALVKHLQKTVPVDTGKLRDSLWFLVAGLRFRVGSPLFYASFQNVGDETPEIKALIRDYLTRATQKILGDQ